MTIDQTYIHIVLYINDLSPDEIPGTKRNLQHNMRVVLPIGKVPELGLRGQRLSGVSGVQVSRFGK